MDILKKLILSKDEVLRVGQFTPGHSGTLQIEQDEVGGHIVNLPSDLKYRGSVALNPEANSVSLLKYVCDDEGVLFTVSYPLATSGSTSGGGYYDKLQSDARYYPKFDNPSGYLTSVSWNIISNKPQFFDGNYYSLANYPTNLSQFYNDLADSWLTKVQADTYYQPLENQRLSTTDDVIFNSISSTGYTSGALGSGFRIDSDGNIEVDRLTVRKDFTVSTLNIREITGVGGSLAVTNTFLVSDVSDAGHYYALFFDNDNNTIQNQLRAGDIIRCQVWDGTGLKYYTAVVGYSTTDQIHILKNQMTGDGVPAKGDKLFQFGNTTDSDRQGLLYLTNSDTDAPFLDILDGVDSNDLAGKTKVRLGKLDGLVSPTWGNLSGYGLYGQNAYLENGNFSGVINITGGNAATKDFVNTSSSTAQQAAIDEATALAAQAKIDAETASNNYSNSQIAANNVLTEALIDGKIDDVEAVLIQNSTDNLAAAKQYSDAADLVVSTTAEALLDNKISIEEQARINAVNDSLVAAKAYSIAQDELSAIIVKSYSDNLVSDEEARAIADAQAKLAEAKLFADQKKQEAIDAAAQDASNKVDSIVIGGRNLLRDSGDVHENSSYPTATYPITETIVDGELMTVTIWGDLGAGKVNWTLYNSGGANPITEINSTHEVAPNKYVKTFNWFVGDSYNGVLYLYPIDYSVSAISTITKIKLEKGNKNTDWTPAPEDIDAALAAAEVSLKDYSDSQIAISAAATLLTASNTSYNQADAARIAAEAASATYASTVANGAASLAEINAAADASNKANAAYSNAVATAEAARQALANSLGAMAYESVVEVAKLGNTILQGGYIKTTLLDVDYLRATIINASQIIIDGGGATAAQLSAAQAALEQDATNKANAAETNATNYAYSQGQTAISTSASDATNKANQAQWNAESYAYNQGQNAINHTDVKVGELKKTVLNGVTSFTNVFGFNVANTVDGYCVIKTKIPASNRMYTMHLKGYNYESANANIDVTFGFYANSWDNGNNFTNLSCVSRGDCVIDDPNIVKGNGDYVWILFKRKNTITWSYPSFVVDSLICSYQFPEVGVENNWTGYVSTDWPQGEAYEFILPFPLQVGESTTGAQIKADNAAENARVSAINSANATATQLANDARDVAYTNAINYAANDSAAKAEAARVNAINTSNAYAVTQASAYATQAEINAAADASNKANTAYSNAVYQATVDRNNFAATLGSLAYDSVVEVAKLGSTVIVGGMIKTNLLDVNYIKSDIINASYINTLDIVSKSIRTATSGQRIEIMQSSNNMVFYDENGAENFRLDGAIDSSQSTGNALGGIRMRQPNGYVSYATGNGFFSNGSGMGFIPPSAGIPTNSSFSALLLSRNNYTYGVSAAIAARDATTSADGISKSYAAYFMGNTHLGGVIETRNGSGNTVTGISGLFRWFMYIGASQYVHEFVYVNGLLVNKYQV